MLVLALILLVVSVGATVAVLARASEPVTVSMFGSSTNTTVREVFIAGVIAGLVFAVSLWLFSRSAKRSRRRRRELAEAKRGRRSEIQRLEAEKADLESRLHETQRTAESRQAAAARHAAAGEDTNRTVDLRDGASMGGSSRLSKLGRNGTDRS